MPIRILYLANWRSRKKRGETLGNAVMSGMSKYGAIARGRMDAARGPGGNYGPIYPPFYPPLDR